CRRRRAPHPRRSSAGARHKLPTTPAARARPRETSAPRDVAARDPQSTDRTRQRLLRPACATGIIHRATRFEAEEQRARDAAGLDDRQRPALHLDAAAGDGVADRIGVRLSVDERICGPELDETMDVAVADHRLAVAAGPAFRAPVEVDEPPL